MADPGVRFMNGKIDLRVIFNIPKRQLVPKTRRVVESTNYLYDPLSNKVFVLPTLDRQPLSSIDFTVFSTSVMSLNKQYRDAEILDKATVWRLFRAFVETAMAFTDPKVIEDKLAGVSAISLHNLPSG